MSGQSVVAFAELAWWLAGGGGAVGQAGPAKFLPGFRCEAMAAATAMQEVSVCW